MRADGVDEELFTVHYLRYLVCRRILVVGLLLSCPYSAIVITP